MKVPLNDLAKLGYIATERGPGTLTISHGLVTVALAASFRETVGTKPA